MYNATATATYMAKQKIQPTLEILIDTSILFKNKAFSLRENDTEIAFLRVPILFKNKAFFLRKMLGKLPF